MHIFTKNQVVKTVVASRFFLKIEHDQPFSIRNFDKLMLTMDIAGAEVGDINHSKEFPPKVVEATSCCVKSLQAISPAACSPFLFHFR